MLLTIQTMPSKQPLKEPKQQTDSNVADVGFGLMSLYLSNSHPLLVTVLMCATLASNVSISQTLSMQGEPQIAMRLQGVLPLG